MGTDVAADMGLSQLIEGVHGCHWNVLNAAADIAVKVIVRGWIGIKPVASITGKLLDLSVLGKKGQVAVYGSEADIRHGRTQRVVNGFCSRMVGPRLQKTADRFSLTTILDHLLLLW